MNKAFLGGVSFALTLAACGRGREPVLPTLEPPKAQTAAAAEPALCRDTDLVLEGLSETLHLEAYVTRGDPALDAYADKLHSLLNRYQAAGKGKIHVTVTEVRDDTTKQKALADGLVETDWSEASGKPAMAKRVMGVVLRYRGEIDTIKALDPHAPSGLELWITMTIRHLRDRAHGSLHRVGVLARPGDPRLTEPDLVQTSSTSMREIIENNFPYRFVDVDAKQLAMDPSLEGLVIVQPASDLTDDELRRIDAFVLSGKSLFVVASAVNVAAGDSSMRATLGRHGLERLLGGYGIDVHEDVVLDFERQTSFSVMTEAGANKLRVPALLDVQSDSRFTGNDTLLDTRFGPFFRIPSVTMPFSSSVTVRPAVQPAANVRIVARSTARAMTEVGPVPTLGPFRAWKPRGQFVQVGIAAAAEGRLGSAFGKGSGTKPAKVFLLASAGFLLNPFVRAARGNSDETVAALANEYAQRSITNAVLAFKATLDWMTTNDLTRCSLEAAIDKK